MTRISRNMSSSKGMETDSSPSTRLKAQVLLCSAGEMLRLALDLPSGERYPRAGFPIELYGTFYERLLAIKKQLDPVDFFFTHTAVGSESWKVVTAN